MIISQYIQILTHDVVHLKLVQSYMSTVSQLKGFLGGSVSKESTCKAGDCLQYKRPSSDPWVRKFPWRRKWQPTPILLPGKSHGQSSLVGYSPWGHKESDMTERLHFHFQPNDPVIAPFVIYPKQLKTYVHTKCSTWIFTAGLSRIAKSWKQPRCPIVDEWINKLWVYLHSGMLFSAKKEVSY